VPIWDTQAHGWSSEWVSRVRRLARSRSVADDIVTGRPASACRASRPPRNPPAKNSCSWVRLSEQELGNLLPFEKQLATVLTVTEVDPDDPAFDDPTKFVGPVYDEPTARRLAAEKGWTVKPDGPYFRRAVASPRPLRVFETEPIEMLIAGGCVVICTGGGGIPTAYRPGTRTLVLREAGA